jgi:anti-sigma factor RsiW
MCDYSGKLVAWLDRELGDEEIAEVQRHIQECAECRMQVGKYQQASKSFDAYCDAVVTAKMRPRIPRWLPVLSTAGVLAIAATVVLVLLRPRVELPVPPAAAVAAAPPAVAGEPKPVPNKVVHRRHAPPRVQAQNMNWFPAEPAIQIAIPAESMFPPGALPEGVNFTADVSLAADGSARQIRLRPRLVGFERRTTQP